MKSELFPICWYIVSVFLVVNELITCRKIEVIAFEIVNVKSEPQQFCYQVVCVV